MCWIDKSRVGAGSTHIGSRSTRTSLDRGHPAKKADTIQGTRGGLMVVLLLLLLLSVVLGDGRVEIVVVKMARSLVSLLDVGRTREAIESRFVWYWNLLNLNE